MNKLILYLIIGMLNLTIVYAQTGLFDSATAGNFATTGIVIVVAIFILREFFKRFKRK